MATTNPACMHGNIFVNSGTGQPVEKERRRALYPWYVRTSDIGLSLELHLGEEIDFVFGCCNLRLAYRFGRFSTVVVRANFALLFLSWWCYPDHTTTRTCVRVI